MGRPRKRHLQQELLDPTGTKPVSKRGGKRKGAGRPPKGPRAGSRHKARPVFKPTSPLHVVLRVIEAVRPLRRRKLFWAIRRATVAVAEHEDCRIIHASIQRSHVHLIVEAADKTALARGIQAFEISAAKAINRALGRRGQVFEDRYHLEVITSPRQARRALAYVLNNWRKHREDRGNRERAWKVDPFSSGWSFDGWKQRAGELFQWTPRETYLAMVTWYPKTWLLTTGWRRHGLVDLFEVPSSARDFATS